VIRMGGPDWFQAEKGVSGGGRRGGKRRFPRGPAPIGSYRVGTGMRRGGDNPIPKLGRGRAGTKGFSALPGAGSPGGRG